MLRDENDSIRDLEVLILSHHPFICVETVEEVRVESLLRYLADKMKIPFYTWKRTKGLRNANDSDELLGCHEPVALLAHISHIDKEAIYYLRELPAYLKEPMVIEKIKEVGEKYSQHRGAIVLSSVELNLPPEAMQYVTFVPLKQPKRDDYEFLLKKITDDMAKRLNMNLKMNERNCDYIINALKGLTFLEAEKVLTKAIVVNKKVDLSVLNTVLEVKKRIIEREGVLEYYPHDSSLAEVTGMTILKDWLQKRKKIFLYPEKAAEFGLPFPKGALLLGVQGCGKSLCAKVVAKDWGLPLLKLDPSNLYQKYVGESERNLKKAIQISERMAPLVLWVDEIEKAFAQGGGDCGVSKRILGTFLSWLQEKKAHVFVFATSNDVSKLPPELLRKGRFDEIFFVDLPLDEARENILKVHLRKRKCEPESFDLKELVQLSHGFSGAEIEQAIISGLYTAFSKDLKLSHDILVRELKLTCPLSITMKEKVENLRRWAHGRTVVVQ